MTRITHRLDQPDRFVAGTIGRPGERTFFLQARQANRLVSVVVEKQQVSVLADHLTKLIDQVGLMVAGIEVPPRFETAVDSDPLDLPLVADFRVGTMTIAWDPDVERIQIELFSAFLDEDGDELETVDDPVVQAQELSERSDESLLIWITLLMGRDFVARAEALVKAGRPPCPLCAQPLDATGHICPRLNGYRAL